MRVEPATQHRARVLFGATFVCVLLLLALVGCSPAALTTVPSDDLPADASQVVTVRVIDNKFEPAEIEIKAGQAVRWVFEAQMDHDVVAEDGSFVSELMKSGEYVHVFDETGAWPYDCSVHPEMTGKITVR